MKKLAITLLALIGVAATVTSCKKDKDYKMDNQEFVLQASSSNMFEIAAANVALNKSSNTNVMAFANHMVTDHSKAGAEMMAVAEQKKLTIPPAMLQKHQDKLAALSAMTGAAFDKQYAEMMVVSHQETIALFSSASMEDGVPDGDIRAFASGKLPTLNHHLEEAITLRTQVNQ